MQRLRDAIGGTEGSLAQTLRQSLLKGQGQAGALGAFAIKVAENPASITDEHVEALRRGGYDDDQIFECIIAAAASAGLARLQKGLALLAVSR